MKESVRIFRFIVIGTMNALIMALVVWLMLLMEQCIIIVMVMVDDERNVIRR